MARRKKKKEPLLPRPTAWQASAVGFVLSAVLGIVGLFVANAIESSMDEQRQAAFKSLESVPVAYMARDMPPGTPITPDDILMLNTPRHLIPDDAILDPVLALRVPRENLLAHEMLREDRLVDPERGTGLNAVIPRGKRALSLELGDGAALTGFLQPGNYVDVVVSDLEGLQEQVVTHTIAQSLFVLAVNDKPISLSPQQQRDGERPPQPSVTLLVDALDAERIVHGQYVGVLVLTMRNMADDRVVTTNGADLDKLMNGLGLKRRRARRDDRPTLGPEPAAPIYGPVSPTG